MSEPLSPDQEQHSDSGFYRYAFEKSPLPMAVSFLDDRLLVDVNPALAHWYGRSRSELIGLNVAEENVYVSLEERARLFEELIATGSLTDRPLELNIPGRGLRYCLFSVQLFNLNDKPAAITVVHDVTELRHQQLLTEQNQAQLQTLTDFEELLHQETDPEKFLNLAVAFLLERMEVDRAWLMTPCDLGAELLEVKYEATRPEYPGVSATGEPLRVSDEYRQLIARHLSTAEPISYGPQQDVPLLQPVITNSSIQSQLIICLKPAIGAPWLLGLHQCSYPRQWSAAEKELVKRVASRLTDRLHTSLLLDDLQKSEDRYRELFEAATESISIVNAETGQFIDFNPATETLFGYSKAELEKLTLADVSAANQGNGDTADVIRSITQQTLAGEATNFEWRYVGADGSEIIAEVTLQALRGNEQRLRATVIDITERRKLEAQLMQAQKMESVGQLAGGIAHDFNNLLQGILGFSDLLLENPDSTDTQRHQLRHIHNAATRAATLTHQLLAFSRRQVLNKKPVDINKLIESSGEMVKRLFGSHIRFDFIPGRDLGTVYSDPVQLEQIMLNLFLNARDAMPTGGVLTVETENVLITDEFCATHPWARPGRYVLTSISDNGKGIESSILDHIFEPFFTTKEAGGSGLGLAMVYGIVKQHDGMIQAYSEPGLGTTFKVYLPLYERPATAVGPKIAEPIEGGRETILVAEDNPAILELAKIVLEQVGYQVITATDGQQAVDIYRSQGDDIDLLLLDVIMPIKGGKQAYEEIQDLNADVRALFSSGYSTSGIHTNFVLTEGLQLIQKPYTPSALLRQVRNLLDQE